MEIKKSDKFGEIHTAESRPRAVAHHIKDGFGGIPIGLVVFGNNSHFDIHGALATRLSSSHYQCLTRRGTTPPNVGVPLHTTKP